MLAGRANAAERPIGGKRRVGQAQLQGVVRLLQGCALGGRRFAGLLLGWLRRRAAIRCLLDCGDLLHAGAGTGGGGGSASAGGVAAAVAAVAAAAVAVAGAAPRSRC